MFDGFQGLNLTPWCLEVQDTEMMTIQKSHLIFVEISSSLLQAIWRLRCWHNTPSNICLETDGHRQTLPSNIFEILVKILSAKSQINLIISNQNQIVFTMHRLIWNSKQTVSVCCSKAICEFKSLNSAHIMFRHPSLERLNTSLYFRRLVF